MADSRRVGGRYSRIYGTYTGVFHNLHNLFMDGIWTQEEYLMIAQVLVKMHVALSKSTKDINFWKGKEIIIRKELKRNGKL